MKYVTQATQVLFLIGMIGFAIIMGRWMWDTIPPSHLTPLSVKAFDTLDGPYVEACYRVHRLRACPFSVERELVQDGVAVLVAKFRSGGRSPGPPEELCVPNRIPISPHISPGRPALYRIRVVYACNPYHQVRPVVLTMNVGEVVIPGGPR